MSAPTKPASDEAAENIKAAKRTLAEMTEWTAEQLAGPVIAFVWRLADWAEPVWAAEFLGTNNPHEAQRILGVLDEVASLFSTVVGDSLPHTNPRRAEFIGFARDLVFALAEAEGLRSVACCQQIERLAADYEWVPDRTADND